MLFNSYVFIFLFLPLALAGYYLLNYLKKYRVAGIFLIGMSLWFYGYFNKSYLLVICGSIAANYLLSVLINRGGYVAIRGPGRLYLHLGYLQI